jgi:L-threonylcarbamoyladenylate synthase
MTQVFDRLYVENHKEELIEAIWIGKFFIYPTDTIYGLGCNALITSGVNKVREMKVRKDKPFSIIAPNKEWILENCLVSRVELDKYLPGPYTLFLKRKNMEGLDNVNPIDNTLGVRMPDHWFTEVVREAGVPFVTTSVNISGEKHMESLEDVDETILEEVDYIIYEGEKRGSSSEKIDLTGI